RVRQLPVGLVPPGGAPVKVVHLSRVLQSELQPQDTREQGVVAVPAVPERLDERIGRCQSCEDARRLFFIGQLAGDASVYPVQDAGFQQEVARAGGLVVEDLLGQVSGDRAIRGGEFLGESL